MANQRRTIIPKLPEEPPYSWTFEELREIQDLPQLLALPKPEQVKRVLAFLEMMRRRPRMYFGFSPPSEWYSQFHMLHLGFLWSGYITGPPNHWDIARERGWERRPTGYWDDMAEQGYSEEEMMEETIVIEIEVWRRLLEKARQETKSHE